MSRLGFTQDESNYVNRIAAVKEPRFGRVWFYSAALVPALAFGLYGLIRADFVALGLGFGALAYFSIWRTVSEVKSAPLFFSIFAKVSEFEKGGGA